MNDDPTMHRMSSLQVGDPEHWPNVGAGAGWDEKSTLS